MFVDIYTNINIQIRATIWPNANTNRRIGTALVLIKTRLRTKLFISITTPATTVQRCQNSILCFMLSHTMYAASQKTKQTVFVRTLSEEEEEEEEDPYYQ